MPDKMVKIAVWLEPGLKVRFDAVRPGYVSQSGLVAQMIEDWVERRESGASIEDAVRAVSVVPEDGSE